MRKILLIVLLWVLPIMPASAADCKAGDVVACERKAEQGETWAMVKLADMYRFGDKVKQDKDKALEYYLQAAEKGNKVAQYSLGFMHSAGETVTKCDMTAHMYAQFAEVGGSTKADDLRRDLEKQMTPYQIATAKHMAADWFSENRNKLTDMTPEQISTIEKMAVEWKQIPLKKWYEFWK